MERGEAHFRGDVLAERGRIAAGEEVPGLPGRAGGRAWCRVRAADVAMQGVVGWLLRGLRGAGSARLPGKGLRHARWELLVAAAAADCGRPAVAAGAGSTGFLCRRLRGFAAGRRCLRVDGRRRDGGQRGAEVVRVARLWVGMHGRTLGGGRVVSAVRLWVQGVTGAEMRGSTCGAGALESWGWLPKAAAEAAAAGGAVGRGAPNATCREGAGRPGGCRCLCAVAWHSRTPGGARGRGGLRCGGVRCRGRPGGEG